MSWRVIHHFLKWNEELFFNEYSTIVISMSAIFGLNLLDANEPNVFFFLSPYSIVITWLWTNGPPWRPKLEPIFSSSSQIQVTITPNIIQRRLLRYYKDMLINKVSCSIPSGLDIIDWNIDQSWTWIGRNVNFICILYTRPRSMSIMK